MQTELTDNLDEELEKINHEIYLQHCRIAEGIRCSNEREVLAADSKLVDLHDRKRKLTSTPRKHIPSNHPALEHDQVEKGWRTGTFQDQM